MLRNISNFGKVGLFTIMVLVIASIMSFTFNVEGSTYMFAPLLTVLILLLLTGDLFKKKAWKELGIHKAGFNHWGFAILLPIIILTVGYFLLWLTPYASVSQPKDFENANIVLVFVKVIISLVIYIFTSSLGEEVGWRGYLLPKLQGIGVKKALLLSGFIHGIFHFPIIISGKYLSEGNPYFVVTMFLLSVTFMGVVFGYLRIKTGSVWPAIILHAVHNVYLYGILDPFTKSNSDISFYLGGEGGIFIVGLYGIASIYILIKIVGTSFSSNSMTKVHNI